MSAQVVSRTPMPDGIEDESRIRALLADWARAIVNRDIDGVLAHHAEDIVLFDVSPPLRVDGIEAYRQSWKPFFSFQGEGLFDIGGLEIVAGDGAAFCHGIVRVGTRDGRVRFDVRLTVGLRKIAGAWVVTHEHHSFPTE